MIIICLQFYHCDGKPANVLLSFAGAVKVIIILLY